MRVLEIGSYVVPAYAGMVLAEQGHFVQKVISPTTPDPILGLRRGEELWEWINHRKHLVTCHAADYLRDLIAGPGQWDVVIDNIRADTWQRWGIDPEAYAKRFNLRWVSMRDDLDGRSFDAVAQARAWMDSGVYVPFYIGDTAGGLWLAFKALAVHGPGHYVVHQAAALAKLVEGELVVEEKRDGDHTPWDEPGSYGVEYDDDRRPVGVAVEFRGETVREPARDDEWRRANLRHVDGRYLI